MPKPPDDLTEKQKVERAVARLGQAINGLVAVFEQTAGELTKEQAEKAFAFAAKILTQGKIKAQLSIDTAIAANGGFDLDREYEATPLAITATLPGMPGAPVKERVFDPNRVKARTLPDDDDGVDFLDD